MPMVIKTYHRWLHTQKWLKDCTSFKGTLKDEEIFLDKRNCKSNLPWGNITFHKISLDSLKRIDRSIPSEIEYNNRYSTWYE